MYFIGIDLGGTNIATGVVDQQGKIVAKNSIKTQASRHYNEIIKDMAESCLKVCKENNISFEDISGIGIGTPGTVQPGTGIITFANNLGFHNVPMKQEMEKLLKKPVFVGNDANVAALGEVFCGGAKGYRYAVTVTLGTGVGAGVIIDGKIYEGFNGGAVEMGHSIIKFDGIQCNCGRRGCWEQYASASALINQTKEQMGKHPESLMWHICENDLEKCNGRTAFAAAQQGDKPAAQIVDQYITYIAYGLGDVINIFQPEIILIGGGISGEGEYLLKPLREKTYSFCYAGPDGMKLAKIEKAQLGNDAGIIGAAALSM
ncbi:MAG: ROK family protein [Bacillota bacterium]|nr:ROK family protein [Bacillota bacterium]